MLPVVFAYTSQEDWDIAFAFVDADGAAIDMSGRSYRVKLTDQSGTVVATLTTADASLAVTGASSNVISGRVDNSVSSLLQTGCTYSADLTWFSGTEDHRIVPAIVRHTRPGVVVPNSYSSAVQLYLDEDSLSAGAPVVAVLAGPSGNTVLSTSGAPSSGDGVNGDFAIDPSAKMLYGPKSGGSWPSGVSFGAMSLKRVDTFTSSGTFTKQSGDILYRICAIGGGGGGGAGRRSASGTAAGGGAGGESGILVERWMSASDVGSTVSVTIGAGGSGASASADSTNGASGSNGGTTYFGNHIRAGGGYGGGGGTSSAGGSSSSSSRWDEPFVLRRGGVGGFNSAGLSPTANGFQSLFSGGLGDGGGGGGLASGTTEYAGSAGATADHWSVTYRTDGGAGGAAASNGSAGNALSSNYSRSGGGGGGGGSADAAAAGNGGAGGNYGAGGGGGGGGRNGQTGGAGGAGSGGRVVVFVYG
jgi:hypothetical protein